ncbi:hypothetical protein MAQ5080_01227 [Marinomonas aquimarina]|jgi:hypothetical protein|uniref:Uncharacterized protein n=2 Tax=Marinomonas TaxID=28253 RepID=A0A1A8T886_9GAMM|nr:hypothetical protein C8D85_2772 [Marinomonas communis]SBS28850.1 hypothetical protein MAQ5080_01227 [Marinomonas aquimarina]|tara:strand:+ start:763 stop:867 length:105 start_codon:yes stop_codon:yes gene_type:complete
MARFFAEASEKRNPFSEAFLSTLNALERMIDTYD